MLRGFKRQAVLPEIGRVLDLLVLFDGLNAEQSARVAAACGVEDIAAGAPVLTTGCQ